jgi:Uma2 family endonuclease
MAASEFLDLPETMTPTQLIDGEVVVSLSPEVLHQDVILNAVDLLKPLVPAGKIRVSPIDVRLDDGNVVQPDMLWMAEGGQCKLSKNKKHLVDAPELIVEVFSPETERLDRDRKFKLYEQHGVKEYWMVHPTAQYIEVWTRSTAKFERLGVYGPEDTFHSPVLDKDVELKALFAE